MEYTNVYVAEPEGTFIINQKSVHVLHKEYGW